MNQLIIKNHFTLSNVGTRQGFSLPIVRTETLRQSVYYFGVRKWNDIIQIILDKWSSANNPSKFIQSSLSEIQGFIIK